MQESHYKTSEPLGIFTPVEQVAAGPALAAALRHIQQPLYLQAQGCDTQVMTGTVGPLHEHAEGQVFNGMALACPIEKLGDVSFCRDYAIRYPYVGGSMAKGISSVAMVEALAHAGMLGFFGAAGLLIEEVESAIDQLEISSAGLTYGFNL
ncbi:MAG: 2-nitropropane dioxygenase, partial [Desulfuromonadales bacterium]|nr:2-nitropropane dioxygenase [Desulfuromonadales bacterium]